MDLYFGLKIILVFKIGETLSFKFLKKSISILFLSAKNNCSDFITGVLLVPKIFSVVSQMTTYLFFFLLHFIY